MADDILPRVAVLEHIARETATTLAEIKSDIKSQGNSLRSDMRSQFHWTLGIIIVVLLAQAALWQQIGSLSGQMTAIGAQLTGIATTLHQHAGG